MFDLEGGGERRKTSVMLSSFLFSSLFSFLQLFLTLRSCFLIIISFSAARSLPSPFIYPFLLQIPLSPLSSPQPPNHNYYASLQSLLLVTLTVVDSAVLDTSPALRCLRPIERRAKDLGTLFCKHSRARAWEIRRKRESLQAGVGRALERDKRQGFWVFFDLREREG